MKLKYTYTRDTKTGQRVRRYFSEPSAEALRYAEYRDNDLYIWKRLSAWSRRGIKPADYIRLAEERIAILEWSDGVPVRASLR